MDLYAEKGLRTLLLARKDVDAESYALWNKSFQEAAASVVEKEELMEVV